MADVYRNAKTTSVLVVEDEALIACDVQQILENNGYRVIGPAASIGAAQALIEKDPPDLALLDVKLAEGTSFPLAEELTARQCKVVFVSGHSPTWVAAAYGHLRRFVEKPFLADDLLAALKAEQAGSKSEQELRFA